MTNSADPDQLSVCKDRIYPGSAGQGLMYSNNTSYGPRRKRNFLIINISFIYVQVDKIQNQTRVPLKKGS